MSTKNRPGEVRDAVAAYLATVSAGAAIGNITTAVIAQLERDVPASSVRSILNLGGDLFVRVGRGRYAARVSMDPVWKQDSVELHQADCLAWLHSREPNSIHGVVTDPPYGVVEYTPKEVAKLRSGKGGVWRLPPAFDGHQRAPLPRFTTLSEKDVFDLGVFFYDWATALLPVVVPGGHVLVACNPLLSYRIATAIADAGWERRGEIVRLVQTMRGGDRPKGAHEEYADVSVMPRSQWEPWLLFRKPLEGTVRQTLQIWGTGGLRRISDERPFGDVIASHPTRPAEKKIANHPSLKPQHFLRQVVRAILPLGSGVVLDPFAGSGSTIAAALAVGYDAIGVERDAEYVALARKSIQKLAAYDPPGPAV